MEAILSPVATLEQILSYKNDNIISRFTDNYNISWEEAEDIFTETKKFLFISGLPGMFMPDDLSIIDEMWHNFICFTSEYTTFSEKYFGAYIHHTPATKEEKDSTKFKVQNSPEEAREEFLGRLEVMMNHTYDAFGQDTVIKWFQEYPVKYSSENIKAMRLS